MAPVNDYGIKVSQRGFDVKTAADYQMVFSSSWPLLKIHSQGSFTINDTTQDVTIATHNLGYVPMFWVFDTSAWQDPLDANRSKIASPSESSYLAMNSTDLKWQGLTRAGGGSPGTLTGYYFIFRYDLLTTFTAPIFQSSGATIGAVGDYGLKASLSGKSINSADLRDYSVHSSARSPMIHMTGNYALTASQTITHNLGYPPMFFVYVKQDLWGDGRYQMANTADDSSISATNTTLTITMLLGGTGTVAYAIFKDPILLN